MVSAVRTAAIENFFYLILAMERVWSANIHAESRISMKKTIMDDGEKESRDMLQ